MNAERPSFEKAEKIRHFRRHQHLAREGDSLEVIFRIEEGCACRYRTLSGGRRQITALFLPGEWCEPQWLLGGRGASPVVALTPVRVREQPLSGFADPAHRGEFRAMLAATLRMLDRQAEWIVALGRKSATERLCALLCDLHDRLRQAGRVCDNRFALPLTQADIADVAGLTPVHVNRVLRELRSRGLVKSEGRWLRVLQPDALRELASGCQRSEPTGTVQPFVPRRANAQRAASATAGSGSSTSDATGAMSEAEPLLPAA